MAGYFPNDTRDEILTKFREAICKRMGITPLLHQRKWWSAADGLVLEDDREDPEGLPVMLPDKSIVRLGYQPRAYGRARVIADLGAFKSGKSFGTGLWAAGFGAINNARVSLVGMEYSMTEPEFNYIADFLLSEAGMNLKFASYINRPRQGDLFLELTNGCRFEAKSWERKDSLKGKENDCYIFCEAYQLPDESCYTSIKQNLVARNGYAIFPTTPDRPWVKLLHDCSHGNPEYPEWECFCGVPRKDNPFTYSVQAEVQDRNLMTSEKYAIAHLGQIGDYIGKVFNYSRGDCQFNASTHPALFPSGGTSPSELRIPAGWTIVGGADTGTYMSALLVAFDPEGIAYVLDEFPNYRYVASAPERNESLTIPQWAANFVQRCYDLGARPLCWADPNTQFKAELKNYGVTLLPAKVPVEARTEITREYFEHHRIFLAPWLKVLPFEVENAAWPEEATAAGKFGRVKDRDHTLDDLEHILARRPFGRMVVNRPKGSFAASQGWRNKNKGKNVHLGKF